VKEPSIKIIKITQNNKHRSEDNTIMINEVPLSDIRTVMCCVLIAIEILLLF